MLRFQGCAHFRLRLLLACLTGKAICIDDIRADAEAPGLCASEASILRLLEKVSNGCVVEINETGTSLRFRPGVLTGGSGLVHDCAKDRAITYFLEPLVLVCMFAKKPLDITLRGVTNAGGDVSLDVFRAVALPLFREVGVTLQLTVKQRAVGPEGTGVMHLMLDNLPKGLEKPLKLTNEGLVRRVRGVAWTVDMGPQYAQGAFSSAKGVLLKLLADVTIFTDVVSLRAKEGRGKSCGYGIALIAETDSGRYLSAERCVSGAELKACKDAQITPNDIGQQAACLLLDEVSRGGVVDGAQQSLIVLLAALGPSEIHRIRLGPLTQHAVATMRHVKDFLGVEFDIKPDVESETVFLACIGYGTRNIGRRVN